MFSNSCQLFSPEQIDSLRQGGKVLRDCLTEMKNVVKEGMTTRELDVLAEEFILSHDGCTPGFKGYRGFPATLCTSVNEQCVHGLPNDRPLQNGDIIAIDCGVLKDDLYTDACLTVAIGSISTEHQHLLRITEQALYDALGVVHEGARVGDISAAVQHTVESGGLTVVSALTGHGLGDTLHQFPTVANKGRAGTGPVLPANTIIAIEPIVCTGREDIKEEKDGWTVSLRDGSYSAHFEHTVLITEEGYEILA